MKDHTIVKLGILRVYLLFSILFLYSDITFIRFHSKILRFHQKLIRHDTFYSI